MTASPGRLQRFVQSLASSYALLVSNVVYVLASVPLALHYLDQSEFGVWAVLTQIFGYLALLDLGMSTSVARLLIDHKDQPQAGEYGSLIKTGWVVSAVQGGLAAALAIGGGTVLGELLGIEPGLRREFVSLVRWQGVVCLLSFLSRMFGHLLYVHQRYDIYNYAQIGQQVVAYVVLWVALGRRAGVFSMIWANFAAWLVTTVVAAMACRRLRCFPRTGGWGRVSWPRFTEMLGYGRDVFLVMVGTQLVTASQTILITHRLGLELAAVWSVCTRTFFLFCQLIWRIFDFSIPALSEMMVRGETARLRQRFRGLVIVSASVSGLAGGVFALCNQPFVTVWTSGRMHWSAGNDLLLAVWLVVQAIAHCHCGFVVATRQVGGLRYVSLLEGVVFVVLAGVGLRVGGLPLLILSAVICNGCLTGLYGLRQTSRYFNLSFAEVAWAWQAPLLKVLAVLGPLGIGLWWAMQAWPPWWQLLGQAGILGATGGLAWVRLGVPAQLQTEFVSRVPSRWQPLAGKLCGRAGVGRPDS